MTTLQEKLRGIGAEVVRHANHVTFQVGEAAVPRVLFAAFLERIRQFGVPPLARPG